MHYAREDLEIVPHGWGSQNAELTTRHREDHDAFWGMIGYREIPSIKELIVPN